MKLLDQSTEDKKFDVRVVAKNVARGMISQKEVDDYARSLPDDAEFGDRVSIDELIDSDDSRRK